MKTYKISDLFYTSWAQLVPRQMAQIIDLRLQLNQAKNDERWQLVGHLTIALLRVLRKDKSLVAKINEEQAVDCLNDIKFIHQPWYHFPPGENFLFKEPDEYMHNRTFNQFIFADAEFTKFCVLDHKARTAGAGALQAIQYDTDIRLAINKLIGILYTPADKFDEKLIHDRACTVDQKLNQAEKAVVLHTYANIREYIVKQRCPNLFPSSEGSEDQTPVYTGKMWLNLRYDLSETPSFPGLEVAKTAWLYDALDLLEKKAIEVSKLKTTPA